MARATIEQTEFKQEGDLYSTARKSDSCYLTSAKRPTPLANFTAVLQKSLPLEYLLAELAFLEQRRSLETSLEVSDPPARPKQSFHPATQHF